MDRQAYGWYVPGTRDHARKLVEGGATHLRVKAGGDGGVAWIPGDSRPSWATGQWDEAYLRPYVESGLKVTPWFYILPFHDGEDEAIVRALRHYRGQTDRLEIGLNPEVEWWADAHGMTLAAMNDYAEGWVRSLRERLRHEFGEEPFIAMSSCPSWGQFPYEGFMRACDQGEPQHYWPAAMLRGEDQVAAHVRRGQGTPQVAILTASREYDDDGVVQLARDAVRHPLAGLSSWECGNAAYQWDAMRRSYRLLPAAAAAVPPAAPPAPPAAAPGEPEVFGPFGCRIDGGFRRRWLDQLDAIQVFGYPVSDEIEEDGRVVQYYERTRMEWHPGSGLPHDVALGRVGAELLEARRRIAELEAKLAAG